MADPSYAAAGFGFARVVAEDADLPAAGLGESADDAQQGGLPGAVAADQGEAGARLGVKNHVTQRGVVAVELPDTFSGDGVHRFLSAGKAGTRSRFLSRRR